VETGLGVPLMVPKLAGTLDVEAWKGLDMQLIHTLFEPRADGPHPTVLALHGWGASAFDLLGLAPYLGSRRFLVLCPQGPVQTPIGPGAVGYGWYPISMGAPPDVPALLAAREQLLSFLDAAMTRHPIDPQKLVLLGFSQGGVMAYSLALTAPERFIGLAALSTWLPPELLEQLTVSTAVAQLPILIQHGSRDELIAVDRARQSVQRLRTWHMPLTYREHDMGHEINARSLADLTAWLDDKVR
jgi:phospholipase/carboxylesterase